MGADDIPYVPAKYVNASHAMLKTSSFTAKHVRRQEQKGEGNGRNRNAAKTMQLSHKELLSSRLYVDAVVPLSAFGLAAMCGEQQFILGGTGVVIKVGKETLIMLLQGQNTRRILQEASTVCGYLGGNDIKIFHLVAPHVIYDLFQTGDVVLSFFRRLPFPEGTHLDQNFIICES